MKHFLWMHPWDLLDEDPAAMLNEFADMGIDEVRLALAYHGGRLVLPRNRRHLVYEQHESAVYFPLDESRFGPLRPAAGPHQPEVMEFLRVAAKIRFPVRAWLVLCHNDLLGRANPGLCVRNFRGDIYSHALCPAQPEVQHYALRLIEAAASLPGITGLDLEALSFMGYEHNSLHDKRAIPAEARWNACNCGVCRGAGDRTQVILPLLESIRAAVRLPIDLRYSEDAEFYGGKTHVPLDRLGGLVDSVTFTYFGKTTEAIEPPDTCPVEHNAGIVFHPPDTASPSDLHRRYDRVKGCAGVGFYCYGLASEQHWNWLKGVIGS